MSDHIENLQLVLFHEIERLEEAEKSSHDRQATHLLGAFVDAALHNARSTRADLARALRMEEELADALLDGLLPEDEIDDWMLEDIAKAIDYDPNLLRILMGRAVEPGRFARNRA